MTRQFFLCFITFFILTTGIQSQDLNAYKYVVVPEGYGFLKNEKDKYQLNSLTEFLFKKYGFNTVMTGTALPNDVQQSPCNTLYVEVLNVSNMMTIKLQVVLKDCEGKELFTSVAGRSRLKEFRAGYQQALRNAFQGIKNLKYAYNLSASEQGSRIHAMKKGSTPVLVAPVVSGTDTINSAIHKEVVGHHLQISEASVSKTSTIHYVCNGIQYDIKKNTYGVEVLVRASNTISSSFGKGYLTTRKGVYLVYGLDWSGVGYFDTYGNFVLERLHPTTGKMISDTFAREMD